MKIELSSRLSVSSLFGYGLRGPAFWWGEIAGTVCVIPVLLSPHQRGPHCPASGPRVLDPTEGADTLGQRGSSSSRACADFALARRLLTPSIHLSLATPSLGRLREPLGLSVGPPPPLSSSSFSRVGYRAGLKIEPNGYIAKMDNEQEQTQTQDTGHKCMS